MIYFVLGIIIVLISLIIYACLFSVGWGVTASECRPSNRSWEYWLKTSICAFRRHPRVIETVKGKHEGGDVTTERCTRCGNTRYYHFGSYLMGHHIWGAVEDYLPSKEVGNADQDS